VDLADLPIAVPAPDEEVFAMHEASIRLAEHDAQNAELVKLRYFSGLSIEETASVLGISERTTKRHWSFARAWLLDAMSQL
jgi:DNA-directed RNA polymerase specialized sigma24 family protein